MSFPLHDQPGAGRQADRYVDGVLTEYKTLQSMKDKGRAADSGTIKNSIGGSLKKGGQARHIVIDARTSGLSENEAHQGLNRVFNIPGDKLDQVIIIVYDFSLVRKR